MHLGAGLKARLPGLKVRGYTRSDGPSNFSAACEAAPFLQERCLPWKSFSDACSALVAWETTRAEAPSSQMEPSSGFENPASPD